MFDHPLVPPTAHKGQFALRAMVAANTFNLGLFFLVMLFVSAAINTLHIQHSMVLSFIQKNSILPHSPLNPDVNQA